MIDKSVAFTVRRARLLLGMTRMQLAELYGVDEGTVYQWELGVLHPKPEIWARLRDLTLKASSALDEDLVKASPLYKYLVDMKDLTNAIVASKGIAEVLEAVGCLETDDKPVDFVELARRSPNYEISGLRALEIIQVDPGWLGGDIVYAELHCMSTALGVWIDGMIAPLPDRLEALIEFTQSRRGAAEGFQVNLVRLQDLPFHKPVRQREGRC
jgi:transcriptional regulator with XRE-family HTH domain